MLLANPLVGLFVPAGSASGVIGVGRQFLFIVAPFYGLLCVKFVCDSVLRGSGAMRLFMVTTFSDLILRVGFSVLLFRFWQELGIWLSWPIGWLLGTGISFWFYRSGLWKRTCRSCNAPARKKSPPAACLPAGFSVPLRPAGV